MNRREFIKISSLAGSLGITMPKILFSQPQHGPTLGQGHFRYAADINWAERYGMSLDIRNYQEMVYSTYRSSIFVLTDNPKHSLIEYSKNGRIVQSIALNSSKLHGLSLVESNASKLAFYITDTENHCVRVFDLKGEEIQRFEAPTTYPTYAEDPKKFIPTESAIAENGDVYVIDGYGAQHIVHYSSDGVVKRVFGGEGKKASQIQHAHGICLDTRFKQPRLLVSDRLAQQLKVYTLEGSFVKNINIPGAYINRAVIHKNELYLSVYASRLPLDKGSGFICILNHRDEVISAPAGSDPIYKNNRLTRLHQTLTVFNHPHDICLDENGTIYVSQYQSNGVKPIKLERI